MAAIMRSASRCPGLPVSMRSDSPEGETYSVACPPSVSIKYMSRVLDDLVCALPDVAARARVSRKANVPRISTLLLFCSFIASPEELRREIRQVILPIAPHVALLGRRKFVLDLMFFQRIAERLRPCKQAVRLATSDIEQLQFLVRSGRVREEVLESLLRVAARGRTERANVVERVQMRKADAQRLAAAHREPRERPIVGLGRDAIELFGKRHHVLQQIFRKQIVGVGRAPSGGL